MPLNEIQAVLFDLDGTLLDTADDLGAALNHVLNCHSLPPVAAHEYRPIASNGAKGLLELGFSNKITQFNFDELRASFLAFYENNIAVKTSLYQDISTLLDELNDRNISWGIVTNKPEYLTKLLLPHYRDFDASKVMVGGDTLAQRKPHPEPLLFAANEIDVSPKNCLYVGDALRDIEAGNAAQMSTAIAQWGYIKPDEDLSKWCADFCCEKPLEILSII